MMEDPVVLQRRPLPRKEQPAGNNQYGGNYRQTTTRTSCERKNHGQSKVLPNSEEKVYYYVMNGPSLFPWRAPRTLPKLKRYPRKCESAQKFPHTPVENRMADGRYFIDDNPLYNYRNLDEESVIEPESEMDWESVSYQNLHENPSIPDYVRVKPWRLRLLEQRQQQHGRVDTGGEQQMSGCPCCSGLATKSSTSLVLAGEIGKNNSPSKSQCDLSTHSCSCNNENALSQYGKPSDGSQDKDMETDTLLSNGEGVLSSDNTELALKGYFLEALPTVWPSFCSALVSVDLSYNSFKVIPEQLCLLENLESLNMQNNPIASLSKEIKNLKNLKHLNISHCLLDKFSKNLCTLTSLNVLDLSYNLITVIPANISELAALEELILDGNMITAFPQTILKLNLKSLHCNLNFTHKLFWRESCPPGAPQRLFDATLLVLLRNEELSNRVPARFMDRVGTLGCACCGDVIVGEGIEVLKPVAEVFGVKHLPLLFRVCSHSCRVALQRTEQSPCPQ